MDYDLQRYGPNDPRCTKAIREIDQLSGELIDFLSQRGIKCIVLSEYGITEQAGDLSNRLFRHQGWLNIKEEFDLEPWIRGEVKLLQLQIIRLPMFICPIMILR